MNLFQRLLLLFIIVPIIEIYLLITVGSFIGVWPTVLLVILTAITGTHLLRAQGLATLQKMQETLQQGQVPAFALLEGILILIGGALLLTPGFFTDAVGFVCLIPVLRRYLVYWMSKQIQVLQPHEVSQGPRRSETIEGEYRREDR
ncbi:MAG: FxsA family protein [Pseudomonadota bacterium]